MYFLGNVVFNHGPNTCKSDGNSKLPRRVDVHSVMAWQPVQEYTMPLAQYMQGEAPVSRVRAPRIRGIESVLNNALKCEIPHAVKPIN